MTNYISTPLSTLNEDLNTIQSTLSSKADKSEIPEVPTDLSSFTNSPGYLTAHQDLTDYATKTYVQEYVDEHGGPTNLSDYVPISAFNAIFKLEQDATSADMLSTINAIIVAVKGTSYDSRKTYVVYTDNSTAELDLTGNVLTSSIPNIANVKAISFGTNVTSLANNLFDGRTNLISVEIPGTVTTIPENAFKYQWINSSSANTNSNLTSIVLNEGLTAISNGAFFGAKDADVTLPSSLKSIGQNAFISNMEMTSIFIPSNVTSIGLYPFAMCYKLSAIVVDEANPNYKSENGILLTKNGTSVINVPAGISGEVIIPNGVTNIVEGAAGCLSNCTSLVLPSTLTSIGLASIDSSRAPWGFSTLTIPSSVTSIGRYCFSKTVGKTIIMEGKTMAQVQGMGYYPWDVKSGSGTQFVCTDGTITI